MYDIFLSYSSVDRVWVEKLSQDLQNAGIFPWRDKEQIIPGDNFVAKIEAALEESKTISIILSPEALQSEWVKAEYAVAMRLLVAKDIRVIPILYRAVKQVPPLLANLEHIDFTQDYQAGLARLIGVFSDETTESSKKFDISQQAYPSGVLQPGSDFYIDRDEDQQLKIMLNRPGSAIARIEGGFESGKTSLYFKNRPEGEGVCEIFIDFKQADDSVESLEALYKFIAYQAAAAVGLSYGYVDEAFSTSGSASVKFTYFMEDEIFDKEEFSKIIFVMDDLDLLFQHPISQDFFRNLRSWDTFRKTKPKWGKLKLILLISSFPRSMTGDLRGSSAFNIGDPIDMHPFDFKATEQLKNRYNLAVTSVESKNIHLYFNGHPALIHKTFYKMAINDQSWQEIKKILDESKHFLSKHIEAFQKRRENAGIKDFVFRRIMSKMKRDLSMENEIKYLESLGLLRSAKKENYLEFTSDFYRDQFLRRR